MTEPITWTQEELVAELTKRFGPDYRKWAFQCPNCKDIATAQDFMDAIGSPTSRSASDRLGQECIGRSLGAIDKSISKGQYTGRGCDWVAYGLFSGPEFVIMPNGNKVGSFPIAPAPEPVRRRWTQDDVCVQCGVTRRAIRQQKLPCSGEDPITGEGTWQADRHRFIPYAATGETSG